MLVLCDNSCGNSAELPELPILETEMEITRRGWLIHPNGKRYECERCVADYFLSAWLGFDLRGVGDDQEEEEEYIPIGQRPELDWQADALPRSRA